MSEVFGKQFCLIHESGAVLYPIRIKNRDTGKVSFRISQGGKGGNTKAIGLEEDDESKVLNRVINEGWAVRVSSLDRRTNGLYKIGHKAIKDYKVFK